ncbi:MAG TPA: hypothetical protein VL860_01815 [Planctomycetota bacterium]|nr:hypothetical protein [Planctomycetota bacterium]
MATQLLPSRPNLDQLKRQAKEFLKAWKDHDPAALAAVQEFLPAAERSGPPKLAAAQLLVARRYSFRSWPRLKQFVETSDGLDLSSAATEMRQAIDADRVAEIARLLDDHPDLIDEHVCRSPNAYRNQRPLAYACQTGKVKAVALLLERGADPAEDGYLAVARAAMRDSQLPVLRLLFEHQLAGGKPRLDPNLHAYSWGPLLLYPCECLAPGVIRYLIGLGADPNRNSREGSCHDTPLQMVLGTYGRSPQLAECVDALIEGGAKAEPAAWLDLVRNRLDALAARLDADPGLIHQRFPGLTFGQTGGRGMTLAGGTLLHIAVEFCNEPAARLLIVRGADVNARAEPPAQGGGTQPAMGPTPLFHAVSQYNGWGASLVQLLMDHGADPALTATLRGDYDKPDEWLTCTAREYAQKFPADRPAKDDTLKFMGL